MTLYLNRHVYMKLSYVALAAYWAQILISSRYQEFALLSWGFFGLISLVLGSFVTVLWLISIYATKRGWLWVTALFSWYLLGLVYTIGLMWGKLIYGDCPVYFSAIGILCTAYLYLYGFLGLFMPILNRLGLLAPEP